VEPVPKTVVAAAALTVAVAVQLPSLRTSSLTPSLTTTTAAAAGMGAAEAT
jgi:hypothetical protein